MTSHQPHHYDIHKLPEISEGVLDALAHDLDDPLFEPRLFHELNEEQHALMRRIVTHANQRSAGRIENQESFIRGAEFVLAAIRRQLSTMELAQLLEAMPQDILHELRDDAPQSEPEAEPMS